MSRRTQDDPRYLRARDRLIEVLRELAAQRPAELLTVSEIAARAGVSRTTFYAHAQTPADLLAAHYSSIIVGRATSKTRLQENLS